MEDNGWGLDTLLLVLPSGVVSGFRTGSSTVAMDLPLLEDIPRPQADLAFVEIDMSKQVTHGPLAFPVTKYTNSGKTTTVKRPIIRVYRLQGLTWVDIDGLAVKVIASSLGGIELNGAMVDRAFLLRGPYPTSILSLDIAPPTGTSIWVMRTQLGEPRALMRAAVGLEMAQRDGLTGADAFAADAPAIPV